MTHLRFVAAVGVVGALLAWAPARAQDVPPDYADPASWLCLPGREDACAVDHATTVVAADGSLALEGWDADPEAPIDCFYVYPTVSTDPGFNSDLTADPAELNVVRQQFARFGSTCRLFAPLYRQVTLAGLRERRADPARGRGPAYDDVLAAWRHYLENENRGRGFVLVGHSQGASILRDLIAREIDGRPVQGRMVSALLIGTTVPVRRDGRPGGAFRAIPVCRAPDQVGCLVSYAAFRSTVPPPANTRFGRVADPDLQAACVHPAALGGGTAPLRAYLSAEGRHIVGTTAPAPWVRGGAPVGTPWVSVPGLLSARCTSNEHATYLEVTVHGDPGDPRTDDIVGDVGGGARIAADWGLHLVDVNLAMGDLVELVRRQAAAWRASGEWRAYGGDSGNAKYSALNEISADNVERLEVAWSWSSPDDALAEGDPALNPGGLKATPIMVDGVLYVRTSLSQAAAIDAGTGRQLWVFDPGSWRAGRPTNLGFNSRGVAYWDGGGERRVFLATGDAYLWALDAGTGRPVESFGEGGRLDLTRGLGRPVDRASYTSMSPPLVVGDVVVVGSSISDGPMHRAAPPGDVRAFDARTGALRWTFATIPRPGEPGHETWEDDAWRHTGNTNVWTIMSADEELGLVYLPVGTPTNDWYGGHRPGDNLFAESLVAVDAATGRRVWHQQLVHHGVWDYDLPAAPTLVDLTIGGRRVKAVAQVTKQGFVYTFDRKTGEPVWPIVERPVPPSGVPGERLSPTQPIPTRPPPFERQGVTAADLVDFTPELRREAEEILARFDHGGLFTPPSLRGTIVLPGWFGGADWQGAAVHPASGHLFVPSRTSPIVVQLVEPEPGTSDFRYVRGGERAVSGPRGLPLVKPPYVRMTALDLTTGDLLWQVPLGDGPRRRVIELGAPDPGPLGGGTYAGPLLTPTLLFVGHSGARGGEPDAGGALLALDPRTGDTVQVVELPGSPTGTPMTYRAGGRQFIAVAYTDGVRTGVLALAVAAP